MTAFATYLLLAASVIAFCQRASLPEYCSVFTAKGCPFISCITTDVSVTCFYQNDTGSLFAEPRWYLDGQPIVPTSVSRYNDTVWQMKYNYCSLCPGEYVFHGKERELPEIEECCGSTPEVSINLTVTAEPPPAGSDEVVLIATTTSLVALWVVTVTVFGVVTAMLSWQNFKLKQKVSQQRSRSYSSPPPPIPSEDPDSIQLQPNPSYCSVERAQQ